MKDLIILSLATYRLAQLISIDNGPMNLFAKLREQTDSLARAEQEENEGRTLWQNINDGLHCPYCTGVWSAIILMIIYRKWYTLVYLLAIAGGQSWLEGKR